MYEHDLNGLPSKRSDDVGKLFEMGEIAFPTSAFTKAPLDKLNIPAPVIRSMTLKSEALVVNDYHSTGSYDPRERRVFHNSGGYQSVHELGAGSKRLDDRFPRIHDDHLVGCRVNQINRVSAQECLGF